MKFLSFTLVLASFLFSQTTSSLLPFEETQLEPQDLAVLSAEHSSLLSFGDSTPARQLKLGGRANDCKVFPGDVDWPSETAWDVLNTTLGGVLIKTVPLAAPCYNGPYYNKARCDFITQNWLDSSIHLADPSAMLSNLYQGNTCLPPTSPNETCTLGGLPSYVINATTTKHVQLGVNFARTTGIRLIVKNTGHDFSGKSGGAGSLSIWTHYFNAIEYIPKFADNGIGYEGPAFRGGSGVIARDLYLAADAKGLAVVGGEGQDVGVLGGYIQGGGHSPLSSIYGVASDQVLEMNLITADGKFITASSTSNTDLFWALRGGGGSTWGVVTSVTIRAHPSTPLTSVRFSFTAPTTAQFTAGVKAYWDRFIQYSDAGTYSYFFIIPGQVPTFIMLGFVAPNKTSAQTTALLQPWYDDLAAQKITWLQSPNTKTYPSIGPGLLDTFPTESLQGDAIIGSRLFPRSAWEVKDSAPYNNTWKAWSASINTGVLISFNIRAPNVYNLSTSVSPAWRETVLHTIQGSGPLTAGSEEAVKNELAARMKVWAAATPGAGAYLGESDPMEVGFQESFWGENYDRLLRIKKSVDPGDVFWALEAVGSEGWAVRTKAAIPDENGRLCRV